MRKYALHPDIMPSPRTKACAAEAPAGGLRARHAGRREWGGVARETSSDSDDRFELGFGVARCLTCQFELSLGMVSPACRGKACLPRPPTKASV